MNTCPSCNTKYTVKLHGAKAYRCPKCGAIVDVNTGTFTDANTKPSIFPLSKLYIGAHGNLNGILFNVVGYLEYEGIGESWKTEEWILDANNSTWYLEYEFEDNTFYLYQPVNNFVFLNGKYVVDGSSEINIDETYPAEIKRLAGDFPFVPALGQRVEMIEGSDGSTSYSIEKDELDTEIYKKTPIIRNQVFKGFGIKEDSKASGFVNFFKYGHSNPSEKYKRDFKGDQKGCIGGIFALIFILPSFFFGLLPALFGNNNCRPTTSPSTITTSTGEVITPTPSNNVYAYTSNCNTTRSSSGRSFIGGSSSGGK